MSDNRMSLTQKLSQMDRLKQWLDAHRPLDSDIVSEMKIYYNVKFTYNSNAIEGNTLTQSETEIVLEKGIHPFRDGNGRLSCGNVIDGVLSSAHRA